MDTDNLTSMAYDCIRYAYDATDVLKSELGAACGKFKTEDEYLQGILDHVKSIEKDPQAYLDEGNLLDHGDINVFKKKIRVLENILRKRLTHHLRAVENQGGEDDNKMSPNKSLHRMAYSHR